MEPTAEHRKHRGYPVRFKSIFSTDRVHIEDGVVTDLSLEGCQLTRTIYVPPDTPIEILFGPINTPRLCLPRSCTLGKRFRLRSRVQRSTCTRIGNAYSPTMVVTLLRAG
jgi:hypothetical protein